MKTRIRSDKIKPETYSRLITLCTRGDRLVLDRQWLLRHGEKDISLPRYRRAIRLYQEAFSLVPNPRNSWAITEWIQVAIAETSYLIGDFKTARIVLDKVVRGRKISELHPDIRVRYGHICFKQRNERTAKRYLVSQKIQDLRNPVYWQLQEGLTIRISRKENARLLPKLNRRAEPEV